MNKQTFLVGGAVRDKLLGLKPKDLDYVVVASSAEEMLANGFKQVGADFPVFLHPETQDEYALARTERKSGKGYNGFTVETKNVTLLSDLQRRDLTINAMAMDVDDNVIDPFNGQGDLDRQILRHVSVSFKEDPVRVLRVARFLARYATFTLAPETYSMMENMVLDGELDHLTPERVWAETAKALTETAPYRYFDFLSQIGALRVVMPELNSSCCGFDGNDLTTNFVKFINHQRMSRNTLDAFCQRIKVPSSLRNLARIGIAVEELINDEVSVMGLFNLTDAFRKPDLLKEGMEPIVGARLFNIISDKLDECVAVNVKSLGINPSEMDGKAIGWAITDARHEILRGATIKTIL